MSSPRARRAERGAGQVVVLLLLLVAIAGAGAWNYHRNLEAEQADQGASRFRGYETEGLEALAEAYREEISVAKKRWNAVSKRRVSARDGGLLADRVQEFARVQRASAQTRELTADLAQREGMLREIEEELDYRRSLASGFDLHWKRLTTI